MSKSLNFKIKNNSGIDNTKVFIGFWGQTLNAEINGSAMIPNKWYTLSKITSFVFDVTTSGRIYVAYNETFTPTGNSIPSVLTPSSEGYNKRFDKFELTFDGTEYGVADLTAIDFWSIPMSLETSLNGVTNAKKLEGIKKGSSYEDISNVLTNLSNPIQSGSTATAVINAFKANKNPLPQGIQNDLNSPHTGLINNAANDFVRIIGPNSYPPFGEPNEAVSGTNMHYPGLPFTPYNTFLDYFTYLKDTFGPSKTSKKLITLGNGKIACIKGEYGGSTEGTTAPYLKQSYNLWASIDDNDTLTIKGSGSVIGTIEMYVTKWDLLNPAAAYGGSPSFSLTKGGTKETSKNNIYAWIFGDFFAGLNIGAIGSSVQLNNVAVGDMNSSEWFAKLPSEGLLFNKLWTGGETNYWNQWAKELNDKSDAYNFSYAERFSAPQISLNPAKADTLTVELLSIQKPIIMPKTINILSVIDVETIISHGIKGGDSVNTATSLGSWNQSNPYVYMITAQGFIDSNSTTRAGSELTIDANVNDTIQWELTCPGSGLEFNAIIANIGIGSQSNPGSLTPPAPTLTYRKIYDKAGSPGYQIVQQTDFVSEVKTTGNTQYNVAFQIMNSTGVSLGFYYWDPFVNALETKDFKTAKASFLKKKELAL